MTFTKPDIHNAHTFTVEHTVVYSSYAEETLQDLKPVTDLMNTINKLKKNNNRTIN